MCGMYVFCMWWEGGGYVGCVSLCGVCMFRNGHVYGMFILYMYMMHRLRYVHMYEKRVCDVVNVNFL